MSPDNRHHNGEYWARGNDSSQEHENPAKYCLYRPTASELLAVLATACEALPPVSAVLLYISAAGDFLQSNAGPLFPLSGEGLKKSTFLTSGWFERERKEDNEEDFTLDYYHT